MDGHIMRCGTISSCQSAATSGIVKCCWSRVDLTHVSGAIASVQTFTFISFDALLACVGQTETLHSYVATKTDKQKKTGTSSRLCRSSRLMTISVP